MTNAAEALAAMHFTDYTDRPLSGRDYNVAKVSEVELSWMVAEGLVEVYTQTAEEDQNGWYHELDTPVRRACLTSKGMDLLHPVSRCYECGAEYCRC